jgi:glutathione reductase (NADPH)
LGVKYSASKILIDKSNHQILGAHLMGHHAEEVINLFSLAMRYQLTVEQIHDTVFGYPTFSYDIHSLLP